MSAIHRECSRQFKDEFEEMTESGIVSGNILNFLIGKYEGADVPLVIQLMLKYSLMVRLPTTAHSDEDSSAGAPLGSTKYIVPPMLPIHLPPALQGNDWSQNTWHTCFVFLSTTRALHNKSTLTNSELGNGFNPPDFFTLLLAKLLSHSNKYKPEEYHNRLSQDMVVVYLDFHRVRLTNRCNQSSNRPNLNAIQLDIEGDEPLGPMTRVLGMVGQIAEEVMKMLHYSVLLPLTETDGASDGRTAGTDVATVSKFLSLTALNTAVKNGLAVHDSDSTVLFPADAIPRVLVPWVANNGLPPFFHVFGSYRWSKPDQAVIVKEYEEMSKSNTSKGKGILMFADIKRLRIGRPFQEEFVRGLICSWIGVPHLTLSALERMFNVSFDPKKCDNLVAEWILMIQLHRTGQVVYPILMGNLNVATGKREAFDWGALDQLSEQVPEETIRKLEVLLHQEGKELDEDLKTMTVKQIVRTITEFLSESIVSEETAENIVIEKACRNLKLIINDLEKEKSQTAANQAVTEQADAPHVPVSSPVDQAADAGKPLEELSVDEVTTLLTALDMSDACIRTFAEDKINGGTLAMIESLDELMTDYVKGTVTKAKAKFLWSKIEHYRANGYH